MCTAALIEKLCTVNAVVRCATAAGPASSPAGVADQPTPHLARGEQHARQDNQTSCASPHTPKPAATIQCARCDVHFAGRTHRLACMLQGLNWYTAALQLDGDGDAAHAFYQEQQQPQPGSSSQLQQVRRVRQTQQGPPTHSRMLCSSCDRGGALSSVLARPLMLA